MCAFGNKAGLIVLWLGIVVPATSLAAPPDPIDSEFRIAVLDPHGETAEVETGVVPRLPFLACYAWRVRVNQRDGMVRYKEVFTLPAAPETWGEDDGAFGTTAPSADRRTAVTERFETLVDGWFGNSWCVAEGDPEGRYRIEVYLEDRLMERFDFEVRDPD